MDLVVAVFAFFFGAAVGSFLNVCIYRLPRPGLSVSRPRRSFCPSCGGAIGARDNIPIVSWLCLRGRCRQCRAPISARYMLVEALTGALFVFLAQRFLLAPDTAQVGALGVLVVLTSALLVASFIDLELRIIPDVITIPGMMVAPLAVLLVPELRQEPGDGWVSRLWHLLRDNLRVAWGWLPEPLAAGRWGVPVVVLLAAALAFAVGLFGYALYGRLAYSREAPRPLRSGLLGGVLAASVVLVLLLGSAVGPEVAWARGLEPRMVSFCSAIAGMMAGAGTTLLVGIVGSWAFRKPAMGFGDVKLMGLLGAFAGPVGIVGAFFFACFLGAVVGIVILLKTRSRYLPFGPFLALGAWIATLWPLALGEILSWYLDFFR